MDLHSYEFDELKAWLENLNLSDQAMKSCLEQNPTTRYLPLQEEVFISFPVYPEGLGSEPVYLLFLCIKNLIVTLHGVPIKVLDGAMEGLTSDWPLTQPDTSALVCLLVMLESAESLKLSVTLKKAVFDLDDCMDDDPDSIDAGEILDQKRSLRTLDSVASAQSRCFDFIAGLSKPFIDLKTLADQFQLVPSNSLAANQNVNRLEKTLADIQQRFDSNQQEKTNHRLAILTILSAIFLPLSFISALYGMNFDNMNFLHFPHAYEIILAIMAAIAVGMFIYFKTRGWMD